MRESAPPGRLVHLRQVFEHAAGLQALAERAHREMTEPARG